MKLRRMAILGTTVVAVACVESVSDADKDGFLDVADCRPSDPDVYPGARETCNGIDDDCNGVVDDAGEDGESWFLDRDGDGFGSSTEAVVWACSAPEGYAANSDDCDDSSAERNPNTRWYVDEDGDLHGDPTQAAELSCWSVSGRVDRGGDCDDSNPAVHPAVSIDSCNDMDDDCDGQIDEDNHQEWYLDFDGDGFGTTRVSEPEAKVWACRAPDGYTADQGDCNDLDAMVFPGAPRVCNDAVDNSCDPEPSTDLRPAQGCVMGLGFAHATVVGGTEQAGLGSIAGVVRNLFGPERDAVLLGAFGHTDSEEGSQTGAIWLADMDEVARQATVLEPLRIWEVGIALEGLYADDRMGSAAVGGVDFDGDGIPEIVVGANKLDADRMDLVAGNGARNGGGVFVVPGSAVQGLEPGTAVDPSPWLQAYGSTTADWVGGGLAMVGTDIAIGATGLGWADDGSAGGVILLNGMSLDDGPLAISDTAADAHVAWIGGVPGEALNIGEDITAVDMNNDGIEDLVVGARKAASEAGRVYVLEGPLSGDAPLDQWEGVVIESGSVNGQFGAEIAAASACDGDGGGQLVVTAPTMSGEGVPQGGSVYLFSAHSTFFDGPTTLLEARGGADTRIIGESLNLGLGFKLAAGGDIDGDGCADDLVVGTLASSGIPRGEVYAFIGPIDGGTLPHTAATATFLGRELYADTGSSVAFARGPSADVLAHESGDRSDWIVIGADDYDADRGSVRSAGWQEDLGAAFFVNGVHW